MTTTEQLLTAEDLLALPDDGHRYELLDGALVQMPLVGWLHGRAVSRFTYLLEGHPAEKSLGLVISGDPGVSLRRAPDRVRGPDVCFGASDRLPSGDPPAGFAEIVPDLIVEVISPHDKAEDVQQKIQEWLQAGARLVWAAYPELRTIVAYESFTAVGIYTEGDTIAGGSVLPDFSAPVAAFFA